MFKSYIIRGAVFASCLCLISGCAGKVLVENFKLENTTIGISHGNPLNVQVGTMTLERRPSKEETADTIRRANAFVGEITMPLQHAIGAGLANSHVKVVKDVSTYQMVRLINATRKNVKMDAKTEAFMQTLHTQAVADGKAEGQPDMLLNISVQWIMATPKRSHNKDFYMVFIQASVVTLKGPGAGMGPVWKTSFREDAQHDRVNNDRFINAVATRILNGLKASKVISS